MLAKPNKVFNKTNKNANQKHQSSFICKTVFIFPYFIVFFSYTQLAFVLFFISSGRFLYSLWPYCRFLFFSSSEKSSYFLRAFFWNLSFIFLIISSLWIFRHFYIWKNIYIKKKQLMLKKWSKTFYLIITIIFYDSFENHLISLKKLLKLF